MMAVVALVAVATGVGVEVRSRLRWAPVAGHYRSRAEAAERRRRVALERIEVETKQIAECKRQVRINKDYPEAAASWERGIEQSRASMAREGRIAEHCAGLRAKYDRAALAPWLPVAPDPPEPE